MRAALSRATGPELSVETIELDGPGEGQVRVRIEASAVCSTDLLIANENAEAPRPYVPGHSAVGVVEEVGPGTERAKVGDRVIITGSMECGRCYPCLHGSPSQCEYLWRDTFNPIEIGTASDGARVSGSGSIGTYSEQMIYHERVFATVQSDLPSTQLALLGCGGMSGVGAVLEVGQVKPGDSVAIIGCGHLGLWMVQAARLAGATTIIAVEPRAERRELAGRFGATELIDPAREDVVDRILSLTHGRGVEVALEATGEAGGAHQAFAAARNGGVAVATSMVSPIDTSTLELPSVPAAIFGKQLRGSQTGGGHLRRDIPRLARLVEQGLLDAESFVSRTFTLDEAADALRAAGERTVITGVIHNNA